MQTAGSGNAGHDDSLDDSSCNPGALRLRQRSITLKTRNVLVIWKYSEFLMARIDTLLTEMVNSGAWICHMVPGLPPTLRSKETLFPPNTVAFPTK